MSELYGIWVISQYSCRFFNGRIIALQRCAGFCHTPTWTCHRSSDAPPSWTSLPLPPYPIPRGCHSSRHHTANSHWLSVLHMVKYMFQCCSLNSFHTLKAVNFKKKKERKAGVPNIIGLRFFWESTERHGLSPAPPYPPGSWKIHMCLYIKVS